VEVVVAAELAVSVARDPPQEQLALDVARALRLAQKGTGKTPRVPHKRLTQPPQEHVEQQHARRLLALDLVWQTAGAAPES
jgi:hypothetical protein